MSSTPARVTGLWRYPVKSMGGEALTEARVLPDGLAGDHLWAVVDEATGTVASAKRTRVWGALLQCRARLDGADADAADPAALEVTLPGGAALRGDDPALIERLSALAGRPVLLRRRDAPGARTMEMEWAPETHEGMEQAIAYSSARAEQDPAAGAPVGAVPAGGDGARFYDLAPVHLLTTSSVRRIHPDAADVRRAAERYRPNIVVGDDEWDAGHVEDGWLGGVLRAGGAELAPTIPVGRCVMVTLPHGDLPADRATLKRIAALHRRDVGYGTAPAPTLGVYADVPRAGTVRIGDTVVPLGG